MLRKLMHIFASVGLSIGLFTVAWGQAEAPKAQWTADVQYLPSYNKLWVSATSPAKDPTALIVICDQSGKKVWNTALTLHNGSASAWYQIPELPEGDNRLEVQSPNGKTVWDYPLYVKKYPWVKNTLGITEDVLPPFIPISYTKNTNTVRVVLRDYQLDASGLPAQIISNQAPILAAPCRLLADGTPVIIQTNNMIDVKNNRCIYEAQGMARTTPITLRTNIEYDGCMRYDLTLSPGKDNTRLDSLTLEIPLKSAQSTLLHACKDFLRANFAGTLPAGTGMVWKNTDMTAKDPWGGDTCYFGRFIPYIWLGNEYRGLSWFADNDKDWGVDPEGKALKSTITREGDQVVLRINLVQVPTTITTPRVITFGLMSSPVKPLPKDWRQWVSGRKNIGWVGAQYFGADSNCSAKYPRNQDWAIVDYSAVIRRVRLGLDTTTEIDSEKVLKGWIERNVPAQTEQQFKDHFSSTGRAFMSISSDHPLALCSYFEEHNTSAYLDESKMYGWEWCGEYYPWWSGYLKTQTRKQPLLEMKDLTAGLGFSAAPSLIDFNVWYANEFIKRGVGCYFDNVFIKPVYKPYIGEPAYDAAIFAGKQAPPTQSFWEENKYAQPSGSIWSRREYYKRVWVLHQTNMPKDFLPVMFMHMTNANVLPHLGFATANLDLEWKDEAVPFQQKYAPDFLRAETLGIHTGNIPYALANIYGGTITEAIKKRAIRTRTGGLLVHEVNNPEIWTRDQSIMGVMQKFGYGLDACQVWNYWDPTYPVKSSDPLAKTLLCKSGDELLLLICTWNPDPGEVVFTFDLPAIQAKPITAFDLEARKTAVNWDAAAARLTTPMDGYGVRIIQLSSDMNVPPQTVDTNDVTPQQPTPNTDGNKDLSLLQQINCGPNTAPPFTDDIGEGGYFGYNEGAVIDTAGVENPAPQAVYQSERYGDSTYKISSLTPNASYTVRLHFAEVAPGQQTVGARVFDVKVNDKLVLDDYDIFADVGGFKAVVKNYPITADGNGCIEIKMIGVVSSPKISGIEVIKK